MMTTGWTILVNYHPVFLLLYKTQYHDLSVMQRFKQDSCH